LLTIIQIKMKKQKTYLLSSIFILMLLFCISCVQKQTGSRISKSTTYNSLWNSGRGIYLEKCSACHIGFKKDEIFKNFIESIVKKNNKNKIKILSDIFLDENHKNKNIGTEKLTKKDLNALIKFIETPQKRGAIN